MRRWKCHKIVEAETIRDIEPGWVDGGGPGSRIYLNDGSVMCVGETFFARGATADHGDYLVRYEDGYLSWSPKKVFEDCYYEMDERGLIMMPKPAGNPDLEAAPNTQESA